MSALTIHYVLRRCFFSMMIFVTRKKIMWKDNGTRNRWVSNQKR